MAEVNDLMSRLVQSLEWALKETNMEPFEWGSQVNADCHHGALEALGEAGEYLKSAKQSKSLRARQKINCDQVAWIKDAISRFGDAATLSNRGISRLRATSLLACMLEMMEICGMDFEDDSARYNAISHIPELYQQPKNGTINSTGVGNLQGSIR
jgi:hypothetical protein